MMHPITVLALQALVLPQRPRARAQVLLASTSEDPLTEESNPRRRQKKNKYAQFSKADTVGRSLRFSNIEAPTSKSRLCETQDGGAEATPVRVRGQWTFPDAAHIDQRDPTTFGFTEVGVVLGAHAIRGELRVRSDSDFAAERLCTGGTLWLRRPRRRAPRQAGLVSGRKGPGNGMWLVQLSDVSSREQVRNSAARNPDRPLVDRSVAGGPPVRPPTRPPAHPLNRSPLPVHLLTLLHDPFHSFPFRRRPYVERAFTCDESSSRRSDRMRSCYGSSMVST